MRPTNLIGKITGAREKPPSSGMDRTAAQMRDGTLTIDCRGCRGSRDLREQECMRCALKALYRIASYNRLVLSGNLDVAYEGGCIQVLRDLADVVRICHEDAPLMDERYCNNCLSRPSLVLERLADSIPYYYDSSAPKARPAQSRAKCASCSERVNDIQSTVAAKIRQIERSSSREAFMVVGESGNA
jgi:hypothetical protein